jgi:UDP-N-acetylmuramoyl-L-alanyl-D-glutamate--2,6-diaminopimelate ligase
MKQTLPPTSIAVNLRRLFLSASFVGCADVRVATATDKSHDCRPGMLFAAVRGAHLDGHDFVDEALRLGAAALLVERPQPHADVPQCIVSDSRRAYAELCAALNGNPSKQLGVAAVTGTNGKTTTTWLIRAILRAAGRQTGVLGTIEYDDGVHTEHAHLTTPEAEVLSGWLAAMVRRRTTHAAIEMSSHALEQNRTAGTLLDVAIVSNITQDHFDYHRNYAAYRASKLRIFSHLKTSGVAVLNADDPGSLSCRSGAPQSVLTYGLERPADVTATVLEENLAGSHFLLQVGGESVPVHTRLIGRHNISNCLAAAAAALHFGLSATEIARGIETLNAVPGRMEAVEAGQPFGVFVDYAHTDDALRRCVAAARHLAVGRVICVFGAGGDRDRLKRPLLGQAAATADLAVVTSDNPRSEDPEQIIRDILTGFPEGAARPHVEVDRAAAICWALSRAQPGDCVVIAGKGHETEQICGLQRHHFDDREVVRRELCAVAPVRKGLRQGVTV